MTPRYHPNGQFPAQPAEPLQVKHPHAAGIDIHSALHWVAVPPDHAGPPPTNHPANLPPHVRVFGTCTGDLEALADWLVQCKITTVAMESTGVYWVPLFELLERRGFEVYLVNPQQTKRAPGRPKSDYLDCLWIQRLHSYGLLTAAFRPDDQVVVLRSYLRQRQMLIAYGGQHIQHMQKALEEMNVKLTEVVSDITGLTGMAIIKGILKGERDPQQLARYRNKHCKRSAAEIARALRGNWREDHLFALAQAVTLYEVYQAQLRACDAEIEAYLRTFADRSDGQPLPDKPRQRGRKPNAACFDVRSALYRMSGNDLTVIEGIDAQTALVILSEVGTDLAKFPSCKQFVSWLGLCPQHQSTAGKIRSRRTRRGSNRVARALRLAALSCHHAKNALGAFYRRIQARCGGPKAVVATARKIAERVYRLLKYGGEYVRQGMEAADAAYRERRVKTLQAQAKVLGFQLVPQGTE